jgi:hypothetical protein
VISFSVPGLSMEAFQYSSVVFVIRTPAAIRTSLEYYLAASISHECL